MNDLFKTALLALGLCAASALADESQQTHVEHKVAHVAHTVADGVERGAKATALGVRVVAHASAHGVEVGAAATARVAKRVEHKMAPSADRGA